MSKALDVSAESFEQEILQASVPVLVDLWAEWCGPCKALGPTIDTISGEYDGRLKVAKVDVQNNPTIASKYGVASIPTLLFFKNGELVDRAVGLQSKQAIVAKIEALL
ncbi:MAG: thioredoxin [Armatimonadota bacterium]|nr:thioredoxin [Armatimonadota bacterium]